MIKGITLVAVCTILAFLAGKLVAKVKMPPVLGWLITGMIVGPHALGLLSTSTMDAHWFHIIINIGEVLMGIIIGSELVIRELKKSGKQILTICLFESMFTFLTVTMVFFMFTDIPFNIAVIFGAIALATAPAPSLSIIKEYNAKGPVSKTLIPLAALDDILALVIFFLVIGVVTGSMSGNEVKVIPILMMIVTPIIIGAFTGIIGVKLLKKEGSKNKTILKTVVLVVITVLIGNYVNNNIIPVNLLLSGLAFSAVIANMVNEERLHEILEAIHPLLGIAFIIIIMSLGAPLDYRLILGAGVLTAIYILARAAGKILGAYTGAKISNADHNVSKYLGFTLLPHSGVSLLFTGIAAASLAPFVPEYAVMIQGTIAAAAVINEIIAVFLAKEALVAAGEIEGHEAKEVE